MRYLILLLLVLMGSVEAAYVVRDGKFTNSLEAPTLSAESHYSTACVAFEQQNWKEAAKNFRIIALNFQNTKYFKNSQFFEGLSNFYLKEYDLANQALSEYLKCNQNPEYFEKAIEYKLTIAEKFRNGEKRRFLGTKKLPKWASGQSLALTIYDEVIAAMPCHDLAAKALFSKGYLLWTIRSYRESVEAYQMLIKRFPKHELAPESYLCITKVFVDQSKDEFQNPDILSFAELNLKRFKQDFPKEERHNVAECDVLRIKEIYARGLYETGKFYEKTNRKNASVIYYQSAMRQFPDTRIAQFCRNSLKKIDQNLLTEKVNDDVGEDFTFSEEEEEIELT